MSIYQPRIRKNADGDYYALIVHVDKDDSWERYKK